MEPIGKPELSALRSRITKDLPGDLNAAASVQELQRYFVALKAVAALAATQELEIDEYIQALCDDG